MYANELEYMMDLDSGLARAFFNNVIKTMNFAIIETLSNSCPLMNLFMHLGFDTNHIRTYGINLVIYRIFNHTMARSLNGCVRNIFGCFMKCLNLHNKKICDICTNKKKCFRQCTEFKNKMCFEYFKNRNKDNSCPCCRYNITQHSKMNKMLEDMFGDGIEM